jgi:hypothetical protein
VANGNDGNYLRDLGGVDAGDDQLSIYQSRYDQ